MYFRKRFRLYISEPFFEEGGIGLYCRVQVLSPPQRVAAAVTFQFSEAEHIQTLSVHGGSEGLDRRYHVHRIK